MKIFINILCLFCVVIILVSVSSCRRSNNSKYFYDAKKDTIYPIINISVPVQNTTYLYGEDIHIVGTVTDLQTAGKGGSLQSLKIQVDELNSVDSAFIKAILLKTPVVDTKEGFTFNEKTIVLWGTGTTFYRLLVTATDYSSRTTIDSVYFTIQ